MSFQHASHTHSANCFFNSLFREWNAFTYDADSSSFIIPLSDKKELIIPIHYYSMIGRHEFANVFFYKKNADNILEINFLEAANLLLGHLSNDYKTTPTELNIFFERIKNSLHNIEEALSLRGEALSQLYKKEVMSFREAEQALVVGHTFHPHPKSRDEFSSEDYKKYAPETGGSFSLTWFLVKPEILHNHISKNFKNKKWMEDLFFDECKKSLEISARLEEGFIPFPVHSWQLSYLRKNPVIAEYIRKGLVIELGESAASEKWHPTSSLRSVYRESSPYMLKFSMSVRLTNSVRHLLPLEVVRGLQVQDVFSTKKGQEFQSLFPDFNILFEPAFMAILDRDKNIISESIVALRMNPFNHKTSSQKIVLATLTQDHPIEGTSLIGNFIASNSLLERCTLQDSAEKWFDAFLEKAVKPFMMAQANYGIYLGAHQQNLILEIKDNMPVASFFRDCQGTGYSKVGHELFAKDVELMTIDNGNILDEKMGNYLFSYYLIINSTFNVVSSIAKDSGVTEESLLKTLREKLVLWRNTGVSDPSCFNYLLDEKELMQKGNFLCSFINMNENTTKNPLDLYNPIPNPLHESRLC